MTSKKGKDILIDYKLMDPDFTAFHRGKGFLSQELQVIDDILGIKIKRRKNKRGK